jgi:hypothetical protein
VAGAQTVDALLLDLPAALWATSAAHTQRLLELDAAEGSAVAALQRLVTRLQVDYGDLTAPAEAELAAAAGRTSHAPVDVAYPLPRSARDDVQAFIDALDAADDECRASGDADCLPPEGVSEFRHWFFGEMVRQIDGAFPTSWPEFSAGQR